MEAQHRQKLDTDGKPIIGQEYRQGADLDGRH